MANKIICDRCGKEIDRSDGVFHIRMYGGQEDGKYFMNEAVRNLSELFSKDKDYCIGCLRKFDKFWNEQEEKK